MRRKARMRLIIFLLTITLGVLALSQASSENAFNAAVRKFPAAPPTGTYFDHLVFIIMENAGMSNICGSGVNPPPCNGPDNPYMSGLANTYGLATQYVDLQGTSQPNYVGIMAATLTGCTSSCGPGTLTETNLVDRFTTAGVGWKAYMEDQTPVAGCDNSDHGFYEIGHNPFVAFHDIDTNSTRCNQIVRANPANNSTCTGTDCALIKDLNSGSAPNFFWVTPNDCNNAHGNSACANGCTTSYTSACEKAGDNYLSSLVPNILNSNTFKNTRAALFITFDEGNGFCPLNGGSGDCMYTVWAGPVAKTSFSSSTLRDHYAFTKTIETNWNLATMTTNDAGAVAMTEFFSAQVPDFSITASPSSLAFPTGNSANSTITLSSLGSFAGTVTLTKSSTPTGLTITLNPSSITLTAGGTGTSTLTASSNTIGNYTATVTGTGGGHTHNTTLTVRVTPPPNFAISVNPTSLTLTHTVSGVGSPVTISPTGDRTVFESSYLTNSFYAKGLYWLFYEDSSNTCEHTPGCLTYTTSTNGSKWAAPTTVPVHITDSDFSVTTNGTSIFYVRYNETTYISDCGRRVQLGIGNLASSGTVAWQPERTVISGASNRVYADDEIILDSNGQIWIAYLIDNHGPCGGLSTDLPVVIHSVGTNYNSWTGNTTLTTANSGNWHIALVSVGNGQVYAAYWIGAHDVHGKLFSGTWQSDEQISSTTTSSDVNSWLFNSGSNVYIIYFDDSTESFYFATRSSAGTWTVNTIGVGETHVGFPNYYSLPDVAGYDLANNQFHLFYMNATTQKIDEWTGSGNNWNKTTGVVSTTAVPYADSITGFIQSNPIQVGGLFYISGSGSPFNLNFAALTFTSANLTGTFTATVTGQNGFTGTVNLATTTTPSTGLIVNCGTTTITGGSGSSLCTLTGTVPGNYNVTVTGVSGSFSHSATVAVTVPSGPDFQISATSPSPANASQSLSSTITISALNGFAGVVTLIDTIPSGLTCSSISPGSITNSGTASVSCSSSLAGNYTLTLTGTSGSLTHSTSIVFQFRDFNLSSAAPAPVNAGISTVSTITVTAVNHFNGVITLTDTVPSGLTCGTINPSSLTGSGTATVSCSATVTGNYTLTITGTSASLVHTTTALFQFRDFTISATFPPPVDATLSATSTINVAALNRFSGTVNLSDTVPSGLTCSAISPTSLAGSGTATVSCSTSIAGNYTLTLIGSSASLSHSATATLRFQDFTVSATSPVAVNAGQSATSTVTVIGVNGFMGTVAFSITPSAGLSCGSFAPISVTGSGSTTVSCSATVAGNYTATITGTSTPLIHNATVSFQFRDFTLAATSPAAVNAGVSSTSTITVMALNHFSGTVSLTDTIPSGLTCGTISPATVTGSGSATVSCTATLAVNYTLTLTATSGPLTHTATTLFQFRDFSATASSPTPANVGTSTIMTITITAANHFNGVVSLTDTVPSGLVCGAVNPSSITGSGTAAVSCNAVVAGNYTLTVTGTSSSLVHNATTIFQFRDFSILASTPFPMNSGSSAVSTITIVGVNHFAGTVSLTDSVPSGIACGSINPPSVTGSGSATVSCTVNSAGNYTLTVTATSGSLSHSATALFRVQDFAISASLPPAVLAGTSATSTITISGLNGFTGTVVLAKTVPLNLTCGSISPTNVTSSGTATVSCSSNTEGNYTLTLSGASGSLSHSATVLFSIQDYTISAGPTTAKVNAGSTGSSAISILPLNGFSGTVTLSPSGTFGLNTMATPGTITGGSGTATVTFSSGTAGNYTATVTSSIGTLTHIATVTVQVVDFTVTASPSQVTILSGISGNSTLAIASLNGFSGIVSMTLTPSLGLTARETPASITASGASTLTVSASAGGDYSVTISATSGSLSHMITVIVHVLDYSLAANPVNLVAPIGSSTSSILTLQSLNGYSGNVSLTFTVQLGSGITPPSDGQGGSRPYTMAPPTILPSVSINPASFQISSGGRQQVTVSVSLPANLSPGNYLITVTATDGTLSHATVLAIVATDFSVTATPNAISIPTGSNATITLNLKSLNFFQGSVTLTSTGSNGGPIGSFSQSNVQLNINSNLNLNLTIQVPSTTSAGNYTITVQGMSGTLSHSLAISVRVTSGFATILSEILSPHTSASMTAIAIFTLLTIFGTLKLRTYQRKKPSLYQRRIGTHKLHRPPTSRSLSYSPSVPLLWGPASRDEF